MLKLISKASVVSIGRIAQRLVGRSTPESKRVSGDNGGRHVYPTRTDNYMSTQVHGSAWYLVL